MGEANRDSEIAAAISERLKSFPLPERARQLPCVLACLSRRFGFTEFDYEVCSSAWHGIIRRDLELEEEFRERRKIQYSILLHDETEEAFNRAFWLIAEGLGLKPREIAEKSGFSTSYIRRLLFTDRCPPLATIGRITAALELPSDYFKELRLPSC